MNNYYDQQSPMNGSSQMMGGQAPNSNNGGNNYYSPPQPSFGSGIGDLLSAFGMSKSHYTNPSDSAMPYLNQIGSTIGQYFNPYINAGHNAMGSLMDQYGRLTNNPGGVVNDIGKNFQQSPGYQFQVNQALGSANRAAAAGGMAGSPMEQQNIAGTVNNLANQDYYNWLGNAENMYGQGLQGLQGINQMGYGASGDMATDLANQLMSQANMAYAGQANQNQHDAGQSGGIWGLLGSAAGNMLPGIGSAISNFL